MNKIYHTVWNESTGTWVAVQETAKSRRKKARSALVVSGLLALTSSIVFSPTASAAAGDGVYFNDGTDAGCTLIIDNSGPSTQRLTGTTECKSTDKSTQTNRALFYGTGSGSTSLSLGGELYVNSGNLGLGGGTTTKAMRIGSAATLNATTSGPDSIAIGSGSALASGKNSIAMGAGSVLAEGADSLAFGTGAKATSKDSIAIGRNALVNGAPTELSAVAIGADTKGYAYGVALGVQATADQIAQTAGKGGIAIGYSADTTNASSSAIAIGNNATAGGSLTNGSIAIGELASSTHANTVAIGTLAVASDQNAVALGAAAKALGEDAISMGTAAVANSTDSIAIGSSANTSGSAYSGIAIGYNAKSVEGAIAIGENAYAESTVVSGTAKISVAVGAESIAKGLDAAAFGTHAHAKSDFGTAIGNYANTSARNATAVGNSASASGVSSSAFGNFSNATGSNATAIGGGGLPGTFQGAQALADGATAVGGNDVKGATASGKNATAISGQSQATEARQVLVGRISVVAVAIVAIMLAGDSNSSVLQLVSHAWAGFGAAFGPLVILSLMWKRMNRNGALAGMIVGALTVIIWVYGGFEIGGQPANDAIYSILPGFALSFITTIVVSLMTAPPPAYIVEKFEEMERGLR